jgi:hypothetical protein
MKSTKNKTITIVNVALTRRSIKVGWRQGDSAFDLDEPDNPLPAFTKAIAALAPLAVQIIHVAPEWVESLRVIGLVIGDQGGANTVSIVCRKSIDDASKEFAFATPPRLLAHPTEPGA